MKCKFPSIFMHAFFLICCNFQRVFLSLWSSKWKWMKRDRFVNARLAWPERCGERMGNWNVSGTVSINIHCYRKCNVKRIKTFKKKNIYVMLLRYWLEMHLLYPLLFYCLVQRLTDLMQMYAFIRILFASYRINYTFIRECFVFIHESYVFKCKSVMLIREKKTYENELNWLLYRRVS